MSSLGDRLAAARAAASLETGDLDTAEAVVDQVAATGDTVSQHAAPPVETGLEAGLPAPTAGKRRAVPAAAPLTAAPAPATVPATNGTSPTNGISAPVTPPTLRPAAPDAGARRLAPAGGGGLEELKLQVRNSAICDFDRAAGAWRMLSWNEVPHLEADEHRHLHSHY